MEANGSFSLHLSVICLLNNAQGFQNFS